MAEAGTQVPAGGVEPGEELTSAVLREAAEETGLTTVTVTGRVAVDGRPHPHTPQPRLTTFFLLRAPADTHDAWRHRVRGAGDDAGLVFDRRFLPRRPPSAGRRPGRVAGAVRGPSRAVTPGAYAGVSARGHRPKGRPRGRPTGRPAVCSPPLLRTGR
ncbi:NUDIX domain-containing protein [Streptomyces sp. NBC_01460]|uniref:NUDIX domain-containing protein n=1 Tax=Streptomyces sp. NBC_01460 TaxID=2903875 RepID=UPI002E2EC0B5|nr:NUDIX domain-containing protein [Streptomyces sp. NBC_01460]